MGLEDLVVPCNRVRFGDTHYWTEVVVGYRSFLYLGYRFSNNVFFSFILVRFLPLLSFA